MKIFITAKRSGTRAPLYSWQIETDAGAIIATSAQMHVDIKKCTAEVENVKAAFPSAKMILVAPSPPAIQPPISSKPVHGSRPPA